jgi:anti-sigma regulatory factor (Ser/Thr protein kinase)
MGKLRRRAYASAAAAALLITGAAAGWIAADFLPHDAAAAALAVLAAASGAAGWAARSMVRSRERPHGPVGARAEPEEAGIAPAGRTETAATAATAATSGRGGEPADPGAAEPAPDPRIAGEPEPFEAAGVRRSGDAGRETADVGPLAAELRLAIEIQRRWQPPVDLSLGACRVTARSRQAAEIGGDLFDAVVLDDAFVAVLIGDVPGKGLQAAFMVPALLLLFRSEVKRGGGPAEMLGRMNRVLAGIGAESLAGGGIALGIGLLDARQGEMRYAGAGHPSPYLAKPGTAPRQLESSSLPLGVNAEEVYREMVFRFAPGERFVLYTDGVIEDAGPDGEMYGFERLEAELLAWPADKPAAEWMDQLLDGQERRQASRRDDRTLLVVECVAGKAGRREELRERCWSVPSAPGCERIVAAELASMLREEWADSGRTDDIVSCVAEAVMNAAEHGNGFDSRKTVTIQVRFGQKIMVCRVRDEGDGFDPEEQRSARAARVRTSEDGDYARGWGIRLIDELTDYWIATRDQNGFCVEMYFLSHDRKP